MSSAETTPWRRTRSDIEDEEEADSIRFSQRSSPSSGSKRVQTASPDDQESEPESLNQGNALREGEDFSDDQDDQYSNDGDNGLGEFQPGAIVRVKLTNFVTYSNAEFFPGPNLNMVIGPNGTGKSSLVCAICLGLGWGPQLLGRAGKVGEFVKHQTDVAEVEIELQKRLNEPANHVVRVRIIRDGNQREWYIQNKRSSLAAVQALTKSLSIQIDNLCQFLPQDKVSEFSGLSPVDLLLHTQRAAAPEYMVQWHNKLKGRRREQKELEHQHEMDTEKLENLESRQQSLQAEVRRLEERQQIQEKVIVLRNSIPFVEYRSARIQHIEYKKRKDDAKRRLGELKERVEPLLATVHKKETDRDQINVAVEERKRNLKSAEVEADRCLSEMESLDELIREKETAVESEQDIEKKKKIDFRKAQQSLIGLKSRLNEPSIVFDPKDWNDRIRAQEQEERAITSRLNELIGQNKDLVSSARAKKEEVDLAKQELVDFESQEGQQVDRIKNISQDTAKAWEWVQQHQNEFEKEVYGPPIISCSVKDRKYVDAMESLLQRNDFLAITAQTSNDWTKLRRQFFNEMKLGEVTLRQPEQQLSDYRQLNVSANEMQRFGLEGWALDLLDGPEPVLAMLCGSARLHSTAIGKNDVSESQHELIVDSPIMNWVAGRSSNRMVRRAEYGVGATSITTRSVGPAKNWTEKPIDLSKRQEIQSKIDALDAEFEEMRKEVAPIRQAIEKAKKEMEKKHEEVDELKQEKKVLQVEHGKQKALPDKIRTEEELLRTKEADIITIRQRRDEIIAEVDELSIRKGHLTLRHVESVSKIRSCHELLLEAQIRLIEAKSDITSLNERNVDINTRVQHEEALAEQAERDSRRVKDNAARALEVCKAIRADPANSEHLEQLGQLDPELTVESLEMEIAAEESKLEFIHANNPNAIRDFEARQVELDKLKDKMATTEANLTTLEQLINKTRSKWEPQLDKLVAQISDAFAHNFEQIGCAGEVSVHKDDDFEQWAIQIKVRFRENETLQILDQHRQSGGERSVSTIFYLMALQALAVAPFRVVDEINQGMDPRNERMVHERMVEIACKEHTSQYFLITPKLLTGLRYDRRMRVLCIASGEHMPSDYKKLDIQKILGIQRSIMAAA